MSDAPSIPQIKEKDLRLAMVCYGGISLAIYQHGITKEILKLVRASKAYHSDLGDNEKTHPARSFQSVVGDSPEYNTEAVYFDLLKAIGRQNLDLRVIVDVIAGSSAGGINGVVLARALAHDLPIEPLTDMWITEADIARVLDMKAKARFWHKWYLRPFIGPLIWLLSKRRLMPFVPDRETRKKLSLFLRSRWFQPPLDGPGFCHLLLDALGAMGEPRFSTASLLPAGHRLDLLVTVTDFYGTERSIYIHDPPIVREREHGHIFRFAFEQFKGGAVQSDFDSYNLPSLAFAARATASFPGAFPPVQIHEMDAALAARRQSWPAREQFLRTNFRHYLSFNMNPESAVFVDGSILNNKPVFEAMEAASAHPAFREVDRRLVYIDPHPGKALRSRLGVMPGFIPTITGALSDLPRYEPIFNELSRIEVFNANIGRLKEAFDSATPRVLKMVDGVAGERLNQVADALQIRQWRLQMAHCVSAQTALLYNNYMQLMIGAGLDYLTRLICAICTYPIGSARAHWVAKMLRLWARQTEIYRSCYEVPAQLADDAALPSFLRFVSSFDLSFRHRRIQSVMRAINRLHQRSSEVDDVTRLRAALDALKRRLYRQAGAMRAYHKHDFLRGQTVSHARDLFSRNQFVSPIDDLPEVSEFVTFNRNEISAIIEQIGLECDFARFTHETDEIMGSVDVQGIDSLLRRELLVTYLGFDVWDMVSFPMISMQDPHEALQLTELHEIIVDRISPDDATIFASNESVLKGGGFGGFAGFFSHAARENDYLLGRLHAVDRLMDILASSVAQDLPDGIDMRPFKKRAFDIILREEAKRLPNMAGLIAELQKKVEDL